MDSSIVLVHGNPETSSVWDLLVARLAEQGFPSPTRLSPPGFAAPVPSGFEPTALAYRDWLVGELETVGGPIDLVGHDWGGTHVALAAMQRPDLLRSWASDSLGILEPTYQWHPLAQIWLREGDGEQWVEDQLHLQPDERLASYVEMGMDTRVAAPVAAGFDRTMGETILALYRASAQPTMSELGRDLDLARRAPGLAVIATGDDNVGTLDERRRAAARADAEVVELEGAGHWWMTENDGRPGADALASFWAEL